MWSISLSDVLIWINLHGSVSLFFLLALGIIGLPIPDETLLLFAGLLISRGQLDLLPALFWIFSGALLGISVSYLIGKFFGKWFIKKGLNWLPHKEHWQLVQDWFCQRGKWTLLLGYYIPGVRHLLGILAGLMQLPFYQFALFAYLGALIWASLFLGIGYWFGFQGIHYLISLYQRHSVVILMFLFMILVLIVTLSFKKTQKKI